MTAAAQPALVDDAEVASPLSKAPAFWRWLTGDQCWHRSTLVCWILLALVTIVVVQGVVRSDFRERPIAGDQTSYLFQALSLAAPDHNLSYDAADMDRWRDVGWVAAPTSLFFQRGPAGWSFAKPYAYSLYLAAFILVLGVPHGVAVANSILLLALLGLSIAILRVRYRGPAVPLAAIAFVFASYAYFYAYVLHQELMLAVLTAAIGYAMLRAWPSRSLAWSSAAVVLMALTLPEKPQFVAIFVPFGVALLWRQPRLLRKAGLVGIAALVFLGATQPYRYYSTTNSWNAYQGERYLTSDATPFDHPGLAVAPTCKPVCSMTPDAPLTSIDGIRARISEGRDHLASVFYYFFGRYTGVLVFMPFALLVLFAVPILARRHLDALAWTVFGAIASYIALNVLVYPNNYYGGGQSLGDRYFLQMAPLVLVFLVAARVTARAVNTLAMAAIVLGVVMLWPHHRSPSEAYLRLDRTSELQRLFPVERNQDGVRFFTCPIYGDCASTKKVLPGFPS